MPGEAPQASGLGLGLGVRILPNPKRGIAPPRGDGVPPPSLAAAPSPMAGRWGARLTAFPRTSMPRSNRRGGHRRKSRGAVAPARSPSRRRGAFGHRGPSQLRLRLLHRNALGGGEVLLGHGLSRVLHCMLSNSSAVSSAFSFRKRISRSSLRSTTVAIATAAEIAATSGASIPGEQNFLLGVEIIGDFESPRRRPGPKQLLRRPADLRP